MDENELVGVRVGEPLDGLAAMRRRLTGRRVVVTLPGGPLTIEWDASDTIVMTGPATTSFDGTFDEDDYPA